MGKSNSKGEKAKEYAGEIIKNINSFYEGLKVRQMDINEIHKQLLFFLDSEESIDKKTISNFLKDKIYNEEFKNTSKDLVIQAIQFANESDNLTFSNIEISGKSVKKKQVKDLIDYRGIMVLIFSILILSLSNQNEFIEIFKNIYIKKKKRNIKKNKNMGYFAKGIGMLLESNESIEKKELELFLMYYLNFLTLLPMNSLVSNNEGIPMKSEHIQLMNDMCEKKNLKRIINYNYLKNYGEHIDIDDFFKKNFLTLKNDNELIKKLFINYIKKITNKKNK